MMLGPDPVHMLHPNAAVRVLRAELLRLNSGHPELLGMSRSDAAQTVFDQIDALQREMRQILQAIQLIEMGNEGGK